MRESCLDAVVDAIPDEMPGRARIEALLALSFETRHRDPEQMFRLAGGAHVVAINLRSTRYTPAERADLQARAWAELANAQRRNEWFSEAEHSLGEAARCQKAGSGDLLLLARLLDVQASLRIDQRRLEEAAALLDTVHELYRDAGETHLAGRALISKGTSMVYDDKPHEAVGLLREGLSKLEPQRDPQLHATGQMTLLIALESSGEWRKARRLLLESGLRKTFAAEPLVLLKLRWLEARIFAGLSKLKRAEEIFSEVEDGFLAAGLEYEAALASLERADVLVRMGRAAEVEALAEEALKTFQGLGVGREAVRAVRFLHEACRQKRRTRALCARWSASSRSTRAGRTYDLSPRRSSSTRKSASRTFWSRSSAAFSSFTWRPWTSRYCSTSGSGGPGWG